MTAGEREARWGHRGGVLELKGPEELIDAIERSLFAAGAVPVRIEADDDAFVLPSKPAGDRDRRCRLKPGCWRWW